MSNDIYQSVESFRPGRSAFDLSHAKLLNCDAGKLIPVLCEDVIPGDIFDITAEVTCRLQPLVSPVLHEIDITIHYFFYPHRLAWSGWEDFITGGEAGTDNQTLPQWDNEDYTKYSLWDYMGFPLVDIASTNLPVVAFPRIAYNTIYNEWYRAEEIQSEVALDNETILRRNWAKDYFTSATLNPQKGPFTVMSIGGTGSAEWASTNFETASGAYDIRSNPANTTLQTGNSGATQALDDVFNNNTLNVSSLYVSLAEFRLAQAVQAWKERNQRAGTRYCEFLQGHFSISPRDDRLDRSEYIGGVKQNILISETLQTSETTVNSPQGNLAGHGISAEIQPVGRYRVEEYGLIMGILSIMPKPSYAQGINRMWLRQTRYDYYHPEFANLSEQAIYNGELYYQGNTSDASVFGYQGRYDEYRQRNDNVCADMRDTLSFWTMYRDFNSLPDLNSSFLQCNPSTDIFAVTTEPGYICHIFHRISALRPLPYQSTPSILV